jgi:hypothetical protein
MRSRTLGRTQRNPGNPPERTPTITRLDWLFFVAELAAVPLWFVARDALWASSSSPPSKSPASAPRCANPGINRGAS